MCPSPRTLVMSCVSACGSWHPFKSTSRSTQSNEDTLRPLLSTPLIDVVDEQQSQKEQLRLLRSLSSHLDILTAGSLFLLPSILPFLASAIIATNAPITDTRPQPWDQVNTTAVFGAEQKEDSFWNDWSTLWILMLPCIGVLIPLSMFKIMSVLEESGFQCPHKRWRKSQTAAACELVDDASWTRAHNAVAAAGWRGLCRSPTTRNSNASMISASCPTILAIQSAWRSWRGHPHGYGPLSLETSTPSSPLLESSLPSSPCQACCSPKECAQDTNTNWSHFSAPPTLPLTPASPSSSDSGMQEIDLGIQSSSLSHKCSGHCHNNNNNNNNNNNETNINIQQQQQQHQQVLEEIIRQDEVRIKVVRSVLPKPRTILLSSLFAWTALMALSSPLGFNIAEREYGSSPHFMPVTGNKAEVASSPAADIDRQLWEPMSTVKGEDLTLPSPSTFMRNIRIGGFVIPGPQQQQQEWQQELERLEREEQEDALFMQNMVSMLDLDALLETPVPEQENRWTLIDRVGEEADNEVTTSIVFLNKRSEIPQDQAEEEEEEMYAEDLYEDAFDPENLQAMTTDPEDEQVFRDFLLRLESEDETPEENPAAAVLMDAMPLEDDNNVPCRSSDRGQRHNFFNNPSAILPALHRLLFGEPADKATTQEFAGKKIGQGAATLHHHVRGQVFAYILGWTDLMILLITMTFGSLLIGLAQSKTLYNQLLDQHLDLYSEAATSPLQRRDRAFWISLISCLLISGSALGLTILMTLTECWDVPSIYFVGIGLAGMILVHAWIPDMSLEVEVVVNTTTDNSFGTSNGEKNEEQEHLIARDLPSPYVQVFVGECPSDDEEEEPENVSPSPISERRNACSLDESRRWEMNYRPSLEPSCFSP